VIGVIFCIVWLLIVRDYPINSKRIKHSELCLIQEIDGTFNELKEQKLQRKVNPKEVF